MKRTLVALGLAAMLALPMVVAAAPGLPSNNVAWLPAAADADIDRAFAQARGAEQAGAAVLGRHLVPAVQPAEGDAVQPPGLRVRCRASSSPCTSTATAPARRSWAGASMSAAIRRWCCSRPTGAEITRLPGEVDAEQVLSLMRLGLAGGRPVKAVLADAQAGKPLTANDWRLLAFYSWETDDSQLVPKAETAAVLATLAAASPAGRRRDHDAAVAEGAGRQRRRQGRQARRRAARPRAARGGRPGADAAAHGRHRRTAPPTWCACWPTGRAGEVAAGAAVRQRAAAPGGRHHAVARRPPDGADLAHRAGAAGRWRSRPCRCSCPRRC